MKKNREKQKGAGFCNRDFVIAAVFVLFIVSMPVVTLVQNLAGGGEKEPSMELKDRDGQDQGWFLELRDGIEDFADGLFLRNDLISLNVELTAFLSRNTYIQSTQVLLGKEGWLFYNTAAGVRPLWDYMGTHHYPEESLEAAAGNLVSARDYFEKEKGIRFVAVTCPNKSSVYPEYMPDTVLRVSEESRADRMAAYLKEHTDVTYLYLKDELLMAKNQAELYYHTDTHWNLKGAFVGLQAVFREVYGTAAGLDSAIFHVGQKGYKGDLATIARLSDKYAADIKYSFEAAGTDPAQYRDEVLLLVGDSFSDNLALIAQGYYREVICIRIEDFRTEMVDRYHPDILIWENVERSLFRLIELDLSEMRDG